MMLFDHIFSNKVVSWKLIQIFWKISILLRLCSKKIRLRYLENQLFSMDRFIHARYEWKGDFDQSEFRTEWDNLSVSKWSLGCTKVNKYVPKTWNFMLHTTRLISMVLQGRATKSSHLYNYRCELFVARTRRSIHVMWNITFQTFGTYVLCNRFGTP